MPAVLARCLVIVLLLAMGGQMAVCIAADHCDEAANTSSDCGCHDCACCSLHVGFPPPKQHFRSSLAERVVDAPIVRIPQERGTRLKRPPRSLTVAAR
jgi:hypothetical protein